MDKKLNEVTKVTDMAYVPVIMADGSIGQIAKSDLASVVAGVMNTNRVFPSMVMGDIPNNDCNNAVETGSYFYYIEQGGLDNSPGLSRFVMDVKNNAGGTYQVAYSTGLSDSEQMRQVLYRPCLNGIWLPWQRIDNFGYNSLAELSAGVAEYIPFGTSPKSVILLSELDNIVETGMYTLHDGDNELYGIALVYKAPGYSVIQFACAASTIQYRRSALGVTDNLQGREWIQLL